MVQERTGDIVMLLLVCLSVYHQWVRNIQLQFPLFSDAILPDNFSSLISILSKTTEIWAVEGYTRDDGIKVWLFFCCSRTFIAVSVPTSFVWHSPSLWRNLSGVPISWGLPVRAFTVTEKDARFSNLTRSLDPTNTMSWENC